MSRKDFEAWISNPPYERMCDRGSPGSAWPGQYKNYETQLAWEAWQAATAKQREKDTEICEQRNLRYAIPFVALEECAAAIRTQGD